MTLDSRLLDILICPQSREPVALMSPDQLTLLNQAVAAGTVKDGEGTLIGEPQKAALLTRDRRRIYRIDDGVPQMLVELAVDASQVPGLS